MSMSDHVIPDYINAEAAQNGFNSIEYAGRLDGSDYYSVGIVDQKGCPVPTGFPTFIKDSDGKLFIISGLDGLDLCSKFY